MNYDIVIVGGGLVGMSFALAMQHKGLRLALLEPRPTLAEDDEQNWDQRVYAITPGNLKFLEDNGIQSLNWERITPVREMQIAGDRGGALNFSAYQANVAALAYIIENRLLHTSLLSGLKSAQQIDLIEAAPAEVEWGEAQVRLRLDNGSELTTRLLVGADGARSWVRQQAMIEAHIVSYQQQGVVANFECEQPHRGIARQWFREDGALVWLPLPGNRISIVWSIWNQEADNLLMQSADAFCQQVQAAGNHCLGDLRLISSPQAFPLQSMKLDSVIAQRAVLLGDAAHVIHPLAGQGVNLGLQDAKQLADSLQGAQLAYLDQTAIRLRRYERARKEQVLVMQSITHGLQKLFNNRVSIFGLLRNGGLSIVDGMPYLKQRLIRHALA